MSSNGVTSPQWVDWEAGVLWIRVVYQSMDIYALLIKKKDLKISHVTYLNNRNISSQIERPDQHHH